MVLESLLSQSHHQILKFTLLAQAGFSACYLISALFVASNSYAGFNAIALGLTQAAVIGLSYYGLYKEVTRTLYGIVLGSAVLLIFMSLQSAIFWGQYSSCHYEVFNVKEGFLGIQCENQAAMKSICAFSVFMFLTYIVLVGVLIRFKNDILGVAPANEAVGKSDGLPSMSDFHMRAAPFAPAPYMPHTYAPPAQGQFHQAPFGDQG